MSEATQEVPRGLRLFEIAGITIWLDWTWLLVAAIELGFRNNTYSTQLWNVLEYLSLFGIVLLHELGHSLACRSVGGEAREIVLWPLGGVARVSPPQRPGAMLWSIVAGPLVNVILAPVLFALAWAVGVFDDGATTSGDLRHYAVALLAIDIGLLLFNLLPIYPLDGGKIVWSTLWFAIGRDRSLRIVAGLGVLLCGAGFLWALSSGSWWLALMAAFGGSSAWQSWRMAGLLNQVASMPAREGYRCPLCGAVPHGPMGAECACGTVFDVLDQRGRCPACGDAVETMPCLACMRRSPIRDWPAR